MTSVRIVFMGGDEVEHTDVKKGFCGDMCYRIDLKDRIIIRYPFVNIKSIKVYDRKGEED